MGAHFEALDEGVLLVPLDPRYQGCSIWPKSLSIDNEATKISLGDLETISEYLKVLTRYRFDSIMLNLP